MLACWYRRTAFNNNKLALQKMKKIIVLALVLCGAMVGPVNATTTCIGECSTLIDGSSGASTNGGSGGRPGDIPPSSSGI